MRNQLIKTSLKTVLASQSGAQSFCVWKQFLRASSAPVENEVSLEGL